MSSNLIKTPAISTPSAVLKKNARVADMTPFGKDVLQGECNQYYTCSCITHSVRCNIEDLHI